MSNLSLDLAIAIIESPDPFPIDLDDSFEWLGYAQKRDAKILLESNFHEGFDFLRLNAKNTGERGRPSEHILISIDCLKMMAMMAGTDRGKDVRRYFLECERIAKAKVITESNRLKELELQVRLAELELEKQKLLNESRSEPLHRRYPRRDAVKSQRSDHPSLAALQAEIIQLLSQSELTASDVANSVKASPSHTRKILVRLWREKAIDRRRVWQTRGSYRYLYKA